MGRGIIKWEIESRVYVSSIDTEISLLFNYRSKYITEHTQRIIRTAIKTTSKWESSDSVKFRLLFLADQRLVLWEDLPRMIIIDF